MKEIDLNCDLGELSPELDLSLMPLITSANIACGGHAGDAASMEAAIRAAMRHGVAVGAHPGYPDRAGFGRLDLAMSAEEIEQTVFEQVQALAAIAGDLGCRLAHVKPHGALYNTAAKNGEVARAIARGVARAGRNLPLMGLAGSLMLGVFEEEGFAVLPEAFADRAYEPDGSLRPRSRPGALIADPEAAARQAVLLARRGMARTLCVHGDSPGAPTILAAVRAGLNAAGIAVKRPTET